MSPPRAAAAVGVVIPPRPRGPSSRGGLASWAGGGGGLRRGLKIRQGPRYWNLARGVVARHGSPPGSPNGSIHQHTRAHTAGGYLGPASTRASHTHAYQNKRIAHTHTDFRHSAVGTQAEIRSSIMAAAVKTTQRVLHVSAALGRPWGWEKHTHTHALRTSNAPMLSPLHGEKHEKP